MKARVKIRLDSGDSRVESRIEAGLRVGLNFILVQPRSSVEGVPFCYF